MLPYRPTFFWLWTLSHTGPRLFNLTMIRQIAKHIAPFLSLIHVMEVYFTGMDIFNWQLSHTFPLATMYTQQPQHAFVIPLYNKDILSLSTWKTDLKCIIKVLKVFIVMINMAAMLVLWRGTHPDASCKAYFINTFILRAPLRNRCTVRPLLSGHPRDFEKWPLNRGWLSCLANHKQKSHPRTEDAYLNKFCFWYQLV